MSGFHLILVGALLYVRATFPSTGWVGSIAIRPVTLLLTCGTLLVGKDTNGRIV